MADAQDSNRGEVQVFSCADVVLPPHTDIPRSGSGWRPPADSAVRVRLIEQVNFLVRVELLLGGPSARRNLELWVSTDALVTGGTCPKCGTHLLFPDDPRW